MIKYWKWLVGGGVVLAVGLGLAARCRKPAPPPSTTTTQIEQTRTTDTATAKTEDAEIKKNERKVREHFRPDGSLASRTITEATTDTKAKSETITVEKVVEKVKTETVVKIERSTSPLGLQVTPEWTDLALKPRFVTGQADIPVGKILGAQVRAGATVRWDTDSIRPEAYGLVVRVELP